MIEVRITCLYCDHKMTKKVYIYTSHTKQTCDKCGDKNVVVRELTENSKVDQYKDAKKKQDGSEKIDYYIGSPAFPEKKHDPTIKEEPWPYWGLMDNNNNKDKSVVINVPGLIGIENYEFEIIRG